MRHRISIEASKCWNCVSNSDHLEEVYRQFDHKYVSPIAETGATGANNGRFQYEMENKTGGTSANNGRFQYEMENNIGLQLHGAQCIARILLINKY